jgi:hypothetical protein
MTAATQTAAEITSHYESLRQAVLANQLHADRRGLALLYREGMAAWAGAWTSCSAAARSVPVPRVSQIEFLAQPTAIVALLVSMALSTLQEQRL